MLAYSRDQSVGLRTRQQPLVGTYDSGFNLMPIRAVSQLEKEEGRNRQVHDVFDHALNYPAGG